MLCLPRETEGPCQEGLGEEWHRGKSRQSTAQEKCQDKVTAPTVCIDQHKLSTKQASERLGKCDFLSPSCIRLNVSVQLNALFAAVLLETPSDFLKTQPNTQQSFLEKKGFFWVRVRGFVMSVIGDKRTRVPSIKPVQPTVSTNGSSV